MSVILLAIFAAAFIIMTVASLYARDVFAGLLSLFGAIFFGWLTLYTATQNGYKKGQIDCANGEINYKLQENPDKTKEWVKKDSAKSVSVF